jgi:hypothetical protein
VVLDSSGKGLVASVSLLVVKVVLQSQGGGGGHLLWCLDFFRPPSPEAIKTITNSNPKSTLERNIS